jgi:acyl-CoA hydrolase
MKIKSCIKKLKVEQAIHIFAGKKTKVNEGIYTFVAVDETGKPIEIPQIIPETALEKERFKGALRRKQLSLVLAGKLKPNEATELKALFNS